MQIWCLWSDLFHRFLLYLSEICFCFELFSLFELKLSGTQLVMLEGRRVGAGGLFLMELLISYWELTYFRITTRIVNTGGTFKISMAIFNILCNLVTKKRWDSKFNYHCTFYKHQESSSGSEINQTKLCVAQEGLIYFELL